MSLQAQIQTEFGSSVEWLESAALPTLAPRDEESARALMAFCGREKVALLPLGNGSKLEIGAQTARLDARISTRHLNHIFDHDAANATVEAGAGVALSALGAVVESARQFVPLDDDGGTLGGAVACNSYGASRLKWGAPRDLVVGLRAALSDGRDIRGGAKVVKNVAGYDLPKLFVGSLGSLGLITRVTIRLRPADAASALWSAQFAALEAVETRADAILGGAFEPTFLRARWRGQNWQLRARFDGGQRAVAEQLARLPSSLDADETGALESEWRLRAQLPITSAAQWVRAAQKCGATALDWDAGLGIVSAEFGECSVEIAARLRESAQNSGGWLRVDGAPLDLKTPALVWGAPRSEVALMRALKAAYDPANVCAPGRLVGGI